MPLIRGKRLKDGGWNCRRFLELWEAEVGIRDGYALVGEEGRKMGRWGGGRGSEERGRGWKIEECS
jgi:hypothetical protein